MCYLSIKSVQRPYIWCNVVFIYAYVKVISLCVFVTCAHTSCVSARTAAMGKRDYTVAEWRKIAGALHYGALSADMSFDNTQSALDHLYRHRNDYAADRSSRSEAERAQYHDYCYTHRNTPCSPTSECQMRLSMFFGVETNNRCVLCSGLTIQQSANDFTYGVTSGQVFFEEPSESASLSLTHMKHLAVYHTPFFVMLILGSVTNKRYTLHTDPGCRRELAATVFDHYKVGEEPLHTGQDHDVAFLKIWWRYMNRHSSTTINIKIPYYLELPNNAVSQYSAWNQAYDRFADRKPEPIYTFIARHCVCRDVWDDYTVDSTGPSKVTMWSAWHDDEGFTVHSLKIPVSKLHIEPILDGIATAHGTSGTAWGLGASPSSRLRTPRLDSVILEESGDPTLVQLHLVMSLQNKWMPLESWLSQTAAYDADPGSIKGRTEVAAGVLGHLKKMFGRYEMPPRKMYNTHLDLMKTFFVNAKTRETISVLPYVCMRKMYRAVNQVTDESDLKKACCGILAEVLRSPSDSVTAKELVNAWWSDQSVSVFPPMLERYLMLCKQGLCDSPAWNEQDSGLYQSRSPGVICGPAWLREGLENREVKQKLERLGFVSPIRITIVELPRTEPCQPQTGQQEHNQLQQQLSLRTRVPECFRGLTIALTVNTMAVSVVDDIVYQQELTGFQGSQGSQSGKRLMTIDYDTNRWQHDADAGPVQPKISHIEPDNVQPKQGGNVSFRDAETDVTFFTHAIFGEDSTPWQSLPNSASVTYDISSFNTGMFDMYSLEQDPSDTSLSATEPMEPPPDSNVAQLFIVSDLDLQNVDYTVLEYDIDAWKVPWVELPPASPSNQDAQALDSAADTVNVDDSLSNQDAQALDSALDFAADMVNADDSPSDQGVPDAQALDSAADMFNVDESLVSLFHNINPAYETNNRRDAINIMNNRDSSEAEDQQDELDPTDTELPDLSGHESGVPENTSAVRRGTRGRRPNVRRQHMEPPEGICTYSSTYISDVPQPRRVATDRDDNFLAKYPKWRSNGVKHEDLNAWYGSEYTPYHEMAIITPLLWETYDPTAAMKVISDVPQTDPSAGLEPHCRHGGCRDTSVAQGVRRIASNDSETNYIMGVEGTAKFCRTFQRPPDFQPELPSIPSVTLDSKNGERTYHAVDLSKPPKRGFRHVHLIVNDFPVPNKPNGVLEIISFQTAYLGHVAMVSNVEGLVVHRVFTEDMALLDTVLNMHTSLQIHPFVPRTFAMEVMSMPFTGTNATANYVGEHVGDWNLGSQHGLANMNAAQKCKLAYHVTLCLVKAQILTMRILGFPLLRLQPARIWRHENGFRLDFLACLLDHITAKLNSNVRMLNAARSAIVRENVDSPIAPVAGGVRAITTALAVLELEDVSPIRFVDNNGQETIDVFYDMYQQLTGRNPRSLESLASILGEDQEYQSFTVPTSNCRTEPFAPFFIRIHNQYVKWNKAVIVEPVQTEENLPAPKVYPHIGPTITSRQCRRRSRRPELEDETQDGSSDQSIPADTLTRESHSMPPPARTARAPRGRARRGNAAAQSSPDTHHTLQSDSTTEPRPQNARGSRGRGRGARSRAAPRATSSQSTQQLEHAPMAEPANYACILDDDYDMNTCASTYYEG